MQELDPDVGLDLLTCNLPATDGADAESVTLLVTGDVHVVNTHPRAAALAAELADLLDATHMLAQ